MPIRAHVLTRLTGAALLVAYAPRAAAAQPSYARPVGPDSDETIHGRIASIDGKYAITVRDEHGYVDHVQLHQGTIINPTGLTLEPGMVVTIIGYNAGATFAANEIDTPYRYVARPVPVYYGPGWWYPGFAYGYGPSFGLVINGGGVRRVPFHGGFYHGAIPHAPPRGPGGFRGARPMGHAPHGGGPHGGGPHH